MGSRAGKCLRRTGEGPPIRGVHIKSQHEGKAHLKQAAPQGATGKAEWGARCRGAAGRDGPTQQRVAERGPRTQTRTEAGESTEEQKAQEWRLGEGDGTCVPSPPTPLCPGPASPAPAPQRLQGNVSASTEWRRRTRSLIRYLMRHETREDLKSQV